MPAQTGKAGGGFNFDKSLKAHAGDETVQRRGYIDLPGGITNGVARLAEAKISKYEKGDNKGKEFFYAAGIVVKPKTAPNIVKTWEPGPNGKGGKVKVVSSEQVDVEGQRTSIMIQLCDRKNRDGSVKSADDFVAEMLNELRLLGADTGSIESKADLLSILEELKEAKPYFKFSTSSSDPTEQYPNPRVWENWHGVKGLEEFSEDEESDVDDQGSDEDEGEDEPEAEEEAEAEESSDGGSDDDGGDEVGSAEESDEVDLDTLAKAADKKGGGDAAVDAQEKLKEIATSAGVEDDAVENADDWKDVVRMIREAQEGGESSNGETEEEAEAEEEENPAPQVGEAYGYQLIDPKTKKPLVDPKTKKVKKPIEVEVTKVDTKTQTVTVKNLEDDKVLKDPKTGKPLAVSWDDLIRDL